MQYKGRYSERNSQLYSHAENWQRRCDSRVFSTDTIYGRRYASAHCKCRNGDADAIDFGRTSGSIIGRFAVSVNGLFFLSLSLPPKLKIFV